MALFDYQTSQRLLADDPSFDALIMAALQRADSANAMLLWASFPEVCAEVQARYDSPGGRLPDEKASVR